MQIIYIYVKYTYTQTHTSVHKYVSSYMHPHRMHTCGSYTFTSTRIYNIHIHKNIQVCTSIVLLCSQEKTLKSPGLRTKNCNFHSELTQTWPHPVRSSNLLFVSILILQQKRKRNYAYAFIPIQTPFSFRSTMICAMSFRAHTHTYIYTLNEYYSYIYIIFCIYIL